LGNTNAALGVFGENGGPTKTIPLLGTSPAIDRGDSQAAPPTDQRLFGRSGEVDIGAYEYAGAPPPTPLGIRLQGRQVVISWPVEATGYRLQRTASFTTQIWIPETGAVRSGQSWVVTNQTLGATRFYRLVQ
jgi:hypothetical protein